MNEIKQFFIKLKDFLQNTANDTDIPERDRKILLTLIILLISPIDIIPDWIPIIGILDDVLILGIILDYFFQVLDQNILLRHYPWGLKSFTYLRKSSLLMARFIPNFIKKKIWQYTKDPYS